MTNYSNPIIKLFLECGDKQKQPTVLEAIKWLDEIGILDAYYYELKK